MLDANAIADALFASVSAYLERQVAPLRAKIADLELDLATRPAPVNGKDADPAVIARMVADAISAIPKPQDGKSFTVDDAAPMIDGAVARAVAALPRAKDGVGVAGAVIDRAGSLILTLSDGSTCELGQVVGTDGKGLTVDDVRPMVQDVAAGILLPPTPEQIADAVAAHFRASPPATGSKGDPGRGIGDILIDADGNVVVTFSDGTTKTIQSLAKFKDEAGPIPDDLAALVSKAAIVVAQCGTIAPRPPPAPAVITPAPQNHRRRTVKTITTRRDASGNLVADVIERDDY